MLDAGASRPVKIELDRVSLDDVGANPERLAAAIHGQLGARPGPVAVLDIARALDIEDIRTEPLHGMEAALVTTPERGHGAIVVNATSSPARRRFSIGHELGHFLNPHHRPTTGLRFECTRADMGLSWVRAGAERSRHRTQEVEANRFAIELLAPRDKMRPFLAPCPDLGHALAVAAELDISREAAARRYVSLHRATLAVVFSRDDRFVYVDAAPSFPRLVLRRGSSMPVLPDGCHGSALSAMEVADPGDWLARSPRLQLCAQTLHQQNGYRTTLLEIEADLDADGEDAADLVAGLDRLGFR